LPSIFPPFNQNASVKALMKINSLGWLLLAVLAGCQQPPPPAPLPRPALIREVGAKATVNSMTLVGEVLPRYESAQGFRMNGKIIERTVDVGARVNKGQLLARLDATDTDLNTAATLADVQAAEASYTLAMAEIARQRQLFAKKFISASALDSKEAELKTTRARLAQASAHAHVAGNQSQYTRLTADRAGVVTMIHAEPGQVIQAGEVVARIADTQATEVLVAVPESRMADLQLNAAVTVKLWANRQKTYNGVVREIAPAAESATRIFNVRVSLTDADTAIKLGMTAGVTFNPPNEQQAAGFLIPSSALTEMNGKKTVWVIDTNNKAQPREVVAGPFREDGVLISSGLHAGEKIAVAGVHTLTASQRVRPMWETAP
jgi:RND family efflux transporter MFP subunit